MCFSVFIVFLAVLLYSVMLFLSFHISFLLSLSRCNEAFSVDLHLVMSLEFLHQHFLKLTVNKGAEKRGKEREGFARARIVSG